MNPLVTEAAAKQMDDMAEWAFGNVTQMQRTADPIKSPDQCYTALQQSLAHYRAAGIMSRNQAVKQTLLTRAAFLRAEADMMLDEQWQAFGSEQFMGDGYRASRSRPTDVSACMDCWKVWDADGYALYQALLYRAECIEAEAKAVQS